MVFWIIVFRSLREFVWLVWCWIWIRLDQIWRIWVLYYEHGFLHVIGIPQTRSCDVVVSMNIWVRMPCVRLGERSKEHIDECFLFAEVARYVQRRIERIPKPLISLCPSVLPSLPINNQTFAHQDWRVLLISNQKFAQKWSRVCQTVNH